MSKFILIIFLIFSQTIWSNFFNGLRVNPNFLLIFILLLTFSSSNFKIPLVWAIFCGMLLDIVLGITGLSLLSFVAAVFFIFWIKNKFLKINLYIKIFLIISGTFLYELLFLIFLNFSLNYEIFNLKKIFLESILNLIFSLPFLVESRRKEILLQG